MLRAAITFFAIGLIALILGAGGIAGLSIELGMTTMLVFVILAGLSVLINAATGKKTKSLVKP